MKITFQQQKTLWRKHFVKGLQHLQWCFFHKNKPLNYLWNGNDLNYLFSARMNLLQLLGFNSQPNKAWQMLSVNFHCEGFPKEALLASLGSKAKKPFAFCKEWMLQMLALTSMNLKTCKSSSREKKVEKGKVFSFLDFHLEFVAIWVEKEACCRVG